MIKFNLLIFMKKIYFLLFLPVLALLSGCKAKESDSHPHSPFHNAISAFTSGEISAASPVMVEFATPVENAVPGESAPANLLVVTPSVRGKAVWAGDRTLVFRPDNNLASGTRFRVEVNLPALLPDEKEPFFYTFRTITQNAWLVTESIGPKSPQVYDSYRGVVRLMLADVAAEEDVRSDVDVRYDGRSVNPDFTRVDNRNFLIELEGIARGDEEKKLRVSLKKGVLTQDKEKSLEIAVPGKNEFRILSARMESAPRNVITVTFSDPLDQGQDMSGLFRLGDEDISWNIDNNRVMLYPGESLRGEHLLRVLAEIRNSRGSSLVAPGEFTFSFSSANPEVEIIGDGTVMPYSDGLYLPFRAVSLNAVQVRIIKIYEHNIGHFLQANTPGGSQGLKRAGRLVHRQRIRIDNDPTLDLGKWNTFSLDLSGFIQPDPGAIYRVQLGFKRSDTNFPCADMPSGEADGHRGDNPFGEMNANGVFDPFGEAWANEESDPSFYGGAHTGDDHSRDSDPALADGNFWDTPNMYYSDFPFHYPPGWSWEERNNPCTPSFYTRERWVSRNILASNLGIMVKGGNDSKYVVTVNDLGTAEPLRGAGVELFNLQLVKIGEGSTGRDGVAEIVANGTPFLLVAKMDRQRGYLRMDEGRVRPVDRFDVSGETVRKGLKGFVFGERGVWRPGDSLFISFMPLVDQSGSLPPNHPVGFELIDPRGRLVDRQVLTHSENRLYTFRTKTDEDAVTGFWTARVTMGGVVFNRSLRIETIRPNRLKVDLNIPERVLVSGSRALFGIDSEWLHGSPASGLRTDVRLNVSHGKTAFDRFSDFIFDDPARDIDSPEMMMFEGRLDARGKTSFESLIPEFSQAPGMLSAGFTTRVFEEGGAFSVSSSSARISPFAFYAGIRSPAGDDQGRLVTGTDQRFGVVSVNSDGTAAVNRVLDYTVYKMEWRWWWEKAEEDLGRYISSGVNNVVDKGTVTTGQSGEASFVFRVDEPDWGRYLVRVVDRESGHATGYIVMVDWPGWAREAGDADGASLLAFGTDKGEYTVGEDVTVTFPSMGQGRARVSLETGSTVLRSWWVEPRDETTSFTFRATDEMTPNVYISVTLIQPHSQTANNRPVRLHGVVPAMVTNPETRLEPVIATDDTWRPDEPAVIRVSEARNREMDYVVAVVDEGLLGLTNYGTPDPWNRFNAREALGVKTWDIYNEVIGAFGGKIEQLFSVGGDAELLDAGEQNQMRRFEPMVRFIGPFRLDRRGKNSHTINIPSYTGSARVMVIATDGLATGSGDAVVRIRKPLMVWSSMPRVMSPEERLSVPVTVFVTEENIRNVTVSLEGSHHYEIVGESTQTVSFDGPGEKNVLFEVVTKSVTGPSQIVARARGGGETSELVTNLEVRMPNPPAIRTVSAMISPGGEGLLEYELPGIEGTNSLLMEAGIIPPMDMTARLNFLLDYPHGCIEQITSAAFPQLYIDRIVELSDEQLKKKRDNIINVLQRLPSYQLSGGGFAYWPGGTQHDEWSSSYAGHFILEAEKHGFMVRPSVKSAWLNSQRSLANGWLPRLDDPNYGYRQMVQAYRLYTLALAGEPVTGAMNRMRQLDDIFVQARWLLASAYALSGMHEVADQLMDGAVATGNMQVQHRTYGSELRDRSILVNALMLTGRRETAIPLVRDMAGQLNSDRWHSTQTTAWALMSIINFTGGTGGGPLQFTWTLDNGSPSTVGSDKPLAQVPVETGGSKNGHIAVSNESDSELFVSLIMTGTPGGIDNTSYSENLSVDARFLTMDDRPVSIENIEQGTDFKYVVRVSNPGTAGNAENLALTQMVPTGWEIRNTRLEGTSGHERDLPGYRDIRDDRVHSYFDLRAGESKVFVIVVHAAFAGEFYLPPVSCSAMYNHSIRARVPGRVTTVTRP